MAEKYDASKYKAEYRRKHYDDVRVTVRKGKKPELQEISKQRGFRSLSDYILSLVEKDTGKQFRT